MSTMTHAAEIVNAYIPSVSDLAFYAADLAEVEAAEEERVYRLELIADELALESLMADFAAGTTDHLDYSERARVLGHLAAL